MKLRTNFILFVQGATAVGIMLVSWAIYRSARSELERVAHTRLEQSAYLISEQVERALAHIVGEVGLWAEMPLTIETARQYREPAAVDAFHAYFREIETTFHLYQSINLVNPDADCVASSSTDVNRLYHPGHRQVVVDRPDFREALAGRPAISSNLVSPATGRPCLVVSAPVRADGKVCAVLRAVVDLGLFSDGLTASLKFARGERVVIMDPDLDSRLVNRPVLDELLSRRPYQPPEIGLPEDRKNESAGTFRYRAADGYRLVAFRRINRPNWVVVAEQPIAEVLTPLASVKRTMAGVSAALALLLMPAMYLLVRPVLDDLTTCQRFARNVRDGRPTAPIRIRSGGELAVLAACLTEMEEGLRLHRVTRERVRAAERLLAEARWRTLRCQINPHFLFNALNSVDALVGVSPEGARQMLQLLAGFYRATLLVPADGVTTLRDELEQVTRYLAIERIRWGDALRTEVTADPVLEDLRLPAFTLQPLVENAVKYGQLSQADPLDIRLSARRCGAGVEIEVANRGRWFDFGDRPAVLSVGVGLENVLQRLRNALGETVRLTHKEEEGWVRVLVTLPSECQQS